MQCPFDCDVNTNNYNNDDNNSNDNTNDMIMIMEIWLYCWDVLFMCSPKYYYGMRLLQQGK